MVDSFINKQLNKPNGYSVSDCCRMFGVSKSGYYAWQGRRKESNEVQAIKKAERDAIKEQMRQIIISRNGVIPGKRTFRVELYRKYNKTVNVKRIAAIMKEMNLVAQMPHKDAYKHQASHNHVCAAPANQVAQDFFIGPRRVILSDITYLYYGESRTPFYLCVFRDAYTRENLGWSIGKHMTTGLVKAAYDSMMKDHEQELKDVIKRDEVYIHHDQGSQYLSSSFTKILKDDGFIQSVSARGNSQDNAPMESFFGRLKTSILDIVAMTKNYESAEQLVNGYLEDYNLKHYQYDLAGLTPTEFYQYVTTGVYPLDSYFGVAASELMSGGELTKVRRNYADKEAKQRREAAKKKRELKRLIDPIKTIQRDENIIKHVIAKWQENIVTSELQIGKMQDLLVRVHRAYDFIKQLSNEVLEELKEPLNWRKYTELNYVFAMNELF